MIRFTTPTNTFTVNVDLTEAVAVFITYGQNDKVMFTKTKEDMEITPKTVAVTLTQEETGMLNDLHHVEIQIRAKFQDETAIATEVMKAPVSKVLMEGVI